MRGVGGGGEGSGVRGGGGCQGLIWAPLPPAKPLARNGVGFCPRSRVARIGPWGKLGRGTGHRPK